MPGWCVARVVSPVVVVVVWFLLELVLVVWQRVWVVWWPLCLLCRCLVCVAGVPGVVPSDWCCCTSPGCRGRMLADGLLLVSAAVVLACLVVVVGPRACWWLSPMLGPPGGRFRAALVVSLLCRLAACATSVLFLVFVVCACAVLCPVFCRCR